MLLRFDERVIGLAVVSLILSTLTVLTIAREKVESPLEVLRNEYPSAIVANQRATFSFAVVAREGFEDLLLRFSILTQKTLRPEDLVDPQRQYSAEDDPEEVLNNAVKVAWLRNQTEWLGIRPEKFSHTFEFQGIGCRMVLWDYSSILESLSGQQLALRAPLTYGAILDENGGHYYFEGESGFFFIPQKNVVSLSIAHNTDQTGYLRDDEVRPESKLPISQAPRGVLNYKAVKKDDTFTVTFTVDPRAFPASFASTPLPGRADISVVQVIRAYLDGVLLDQPIINIMA